MPDWLKRPLRTLFQASTAGVIVAVLEAFVLDFTPEQNLALMAGLSLLVSMGQNALEDSGAIPTMQKERGSA